MYTLTVEPLAIKVRLHYSLNMNDMKVLEQNNIILYLSNPEQAIPALLELL